MSTNGIHDSEQQLNTNTFTAEQAKPMNNNANKKPQSSLFTV